MWENSIATLSRNTSSAYPLTCPGRVMLPNEVKTHEATSPFRCAVHADRAADRRNSDARKTSSIVPRWGYFFCDVRFAVFWCFCFRRCGPYRRRPSHRNFQPRQPQNFPATPATKKIPATAPPATEVPRSQPHRGVASTLADGGCCWPVRAPAALLAPERSAATDEERQSHQPRWRTIEPIVYP